ncbi:MAG: aminodeoxychorismate synthase component I [Gammaproteobacteria bacterium]|nr:aminodeoxychorismate synthase component I [Gammaproteobacteria bacterium]
MVQAYSYEIKYKKPHIYFNVFKDEEWSVLLESARYSEELGRYSFICTDPFETLICKDGKVNLNSDLMNLDPLEYLKKASRKFKLNHIHDRPPFQGGVAGYLSYDFCHFFEKISFHRTDDLEFPDVSVGLYDLVVGFDHLNEKAWIFSSGFPELDENKRRRRAEERYGWMLEKLNQLEKLGEPKKLSKCVLKKEEITSNFTKAEYKKSVGEVINYILEGDIFEANISQRFIATLPLELPPYDLYQRLRVFNSAPFSAYINHGNVKLLSASPERFLKVSGDVVEARPIKGTRPRGKSAEEDMEFIKELETSEKDFSENVMIVDLMRNDLSRVCEDNSVVVEKLCGIETFSTVHHLVSVIIGKLLSDNGPFEVLKATFPGGSITGAPKIRSMEIISKIEPTCRGPYCGSIGYIGFNGELDLSITIRTFSIKDNKITFQVGGAIVLGSDPEFEYEETLHKASGLMRSLTDVI